MGHLLCDKVVAVLIAHLTFDLRGLVRILTGTNENIQFFQKIFEISNFFFNFFNLQAYADVLAKWRILADICQYNTVVYFL